jgi:hypothetical protein
MGLFVATDGVDKSYVAREHLDAFFREVIVEAQRMREEELCALIAQMLADVSKFGSRDDASLACIIENQIVPSKVDSLHRMNDSLRLRYELTETREKLISMSRKHDLLRERSLDGDEEATREYAVYHATWKNLRDCEHALVEQVTAIDAAFDGPPGGGPCLAESGESELEDDEERTEPMSEHPFIDKEESVLPAPIACSASRAVMPSTALDESSGEKVDHRNIRPLVWVVLLLACVCGVWVIMTLCLKGA